jgi:HEAT repeat protein
LIFVSFQILEILNGSSSNVTFPAFLLEFGCDQTRVFYFQKESKMNLQHNALTNKLQDVDKNVRIKAALDIGALGVGALGNSTVLPALTAQLVQEPDFFVRENITWAIVRMGKAAVMPMMALLEHTDPMARFQAAHALSKLGDTRAVNALVIALQDEHLEVVQKAAFALGQLKDETAIPALVDLLGDKHPELQTTVQKALEGFGIAALPMLELAVHHQDWVAREQAVTLIGFMAEDTTIPLLTTALHDDHWQVRFAAVNALGAIQNPQAKDALQVSLNDQHQQIRLMAATFLAR